MAAVFEKNLKLLEEIVHQLEEGDATLDESLKAFEKGIKLSRQCHKELTSAEQKVEILLKEDGRIVGKESFEA